MLNDTTHQAVKALSAQYKVAIPEIVSRMVEHVLTSDNATEIIADLLSDAPKSARGRKPMTEAEKAQRKLSKALDQAKGAGVDVAALQASLDSVFKATR